jgi:protein involved in polysaccharide export with SLBB domain
MVGDVNPSAYTVPLVLLALAGCAHGRWPDRPAPTDPVALAHPDPSRVVVVARPPSDATTPAYRIACPDVLEVRFAATPQWDCLASVGVDGRLPVGPTALVAVHGGTVADARIAVAAAFGVEPAGVTVTVADPRAGAVDLYGPESNRHRAVAYRGPESVLEFLHRTGALKRGCFDPRDVNVLRPNVAAGFPAEVFRVDLDAIVLDGDGRTNIAIAAGDQVYVGESRRSSFARLLPTRLKPAYQRLMGIVPDGWPWVRLDRRPTPVFADR